MVTQEALSRRPQAHRSSAPAVLAAACCGVFVGFGSIVVYTFGVFLKPLTIEFGWSRTQVSLAFTLAALTVAVCSPMLGSLMDKVPVRRVILPCTLVYAVSLASLSLLTRHLWHLYAVFVLLGAVANGTAQLGYARVVSAWFDARRGQALAAVMAGSGLGSMVFPPLAQALISHWGWRAAYALLGALALLIAVPMTWAFLFEPEGVVAQTPVEPFAARGVGRSVWSAPFLSIAAALLCFAFATNGLNTHWAALLSDGGATPGQVGLVLAVAGGAALAGKLGTGYLLDRFRAGRAAAVLLALCAFGFWVVIQPYRLTAAVLSAVLVGVAMGAESDVVPYLLTRYFGLRRFGVLYGYTWCVYAVAGATGPLVMGAVFDRSGSYRAVLMVGLVLVVVAAVLFAALPRYRGASQEA